MQNIEYPLFIKETINNYLKPLNPYTPEETMTLWIILSVSRILCHNRVKITMPWFELYPNIYGIIFLPSWLWKDKPLYDIEDCLIDIKKENQKKYIWYKEEAEIYLRKEAELLWLTKWETGKPPYNQWWIHERNTWGGTCYKRATRKGLILKFALA